MKYYIEGLPRFQSVITSILGEYGYDLTEKHDDADIFIVDCDGRNAELGSDKPTILMSSSSVYSCLNSNNQVVQVPFTEDQPLVIPSTLGCHEQLVWAIGESHGLVHHPNSMTLRICNVFGCGGSIIDFAMYDLQNSNTFEVYHSLYRVKSFLYINDFEDIMRKMIKLFLEGLRGVYNIGGTDIANLKSVLKSVYTHVGDKSKELDLKVIEVSRFCNFYEAVDITRIKALTNWEPKFSIRSGIYDYAKRLSIHS